MIGFPGYDSADDETKNQYHKILKCVFPGSQYLEDEMGHRAYVIGGLNQYVVFGKLINRLGFKDGAEWLAIVKEKGRRGDFKGETLDKEDSNRLYQHILQML